MKNFALILTNVIVAVISTSTGRLQTINKHNFGFVLHKRRNVFVQTAEAKMVFHYELPQKDINVDFAPINCSLLHGRDTLTCRGLIPLLLRKYHAFKLNAVNHLQNQLNNVYDILLHLPRKERLMKRGFWTDALSKITGLATKDEVSDVTSVLNRVEIGIQKAADAWKSGSSHFLAAFKVEKRRVDNIYELIEM